MQNADYFELIYTLIDPLRVLFGIEKIQELVNKATQGTPLKGIIITDSGVNFAIVKAHLEGDLGQSDLVKQSFNKLIAQLANFSKGALGESGLGHLQSRLQLLERRRSELEQRVAERTHALEVANRAALESNKRLRLIAEELTIAQAEIQKTVAGKGEFLNIVAHELRTPLQPIIGYADKLLRRSDTGAWQKERLKIILSSAERLLRLVQDILDINKMETGTMKFRFEGVRMENFVEEVYKSFKPSVEEKGLTFTLDIPGALGVVNADPHRLNQAFGNLITNAIKFTSKGSITISAKADGQTIKISVADTGIGIEEQYLPKIFTKFFQIDAHTKRRGEGTGLGLAIVNIIVEAHKGKVYVESSPGAGSTFIVVLPKII